MKADAVVNVVNLTKKYGDVTVLDGLNLRVERGRRLPCSGPTAPEKRRPSRSSEAWFLETQAPSKSSAKIRPTTPIRFGRPG